MTGPLAIDGGTPVRKEFLVFGSPDLKQAEVDEITDSIRSGWVGTGPKVGAFEHKFAEYIGTKHAVAVSSCTAALHLSMLAGGIGPGDEVITTPMTFAATANAIVHVGARPVFVDVQKQTMNIDPDLIEAAITDRTRAVVPVHFAGRPCPMDRITDIAQQNRLLLVEDAAHCIEGWHQGRKIGTIGDLTCFSFYVTKNLTTVEGGMVTTDDEERAGRIKMFALHGMTKDAWARYSDEGFRHYEVVAPGFKYNMTDIQASIGLHQLERLQAGLETREKIWHRYDDAFRDLPILLPEPPSPDMAHARHLYTLLVDLERLSVGRDQVLDALQAENIGCGVHYRAVHLHPFYRETLQLAPGDLPNASWISDRILSIPLSAKLTDQDVDDTIGAVVKVLTAYRR
ncbi:MAG: DegT/DnrJ/EryC1/StrS family aminotransferase [Actinomycetota bacterium]